MRTHIYPVADSTDLDGHRKTWRMQEKKTMGTVIVTGNDAKREGRKKQEKKLENGQVMGRQSCK